MRCLLGVVTVLFLLCSSEYEAHVAEHRKQADARKPYKCGLCVKRYAKESGLRYHLVVDHSVGVRDWIFFAQ